ncbi:DUF2804 domain-containing protein [Agromyces sp. GXS1127]|uniref:DUF2804 domain-containing protein n=1 Tax=Agromyces sp. GXS1127 TaxID=3424181 RepID=UPI003D3173AB
MPQPVVERELIDPVTLCGPDGRLDRDAVGWSRRPLHDTSGIGRGRVAWGRNKRWEYWAIVSPTHLVALTVSSLDYAGVHNLLVHDRRTRETIDLGAVAPLARGATLPASLGDGPARARTRDLSIDIDDEPGATRLHATAPEVELDVTVIRPADRDALAVVVPWSDRRFQYTVKDIGLPASGTLRVAGETVRFATDDTWAALDHGRGRWPYRMTWNWAAGAGRSGGRDLALQLGAKWTDGTGSTENAIIVDGRLHKVSEELDWEYDTADWLEPWRIRGSSLDLTFTPFWDRVSRTELLVIGTRGHQCFGHWSGWVEVDGRRLAVDGLEGWAEEIRNRW